MGMPRVNTDLLSQPTHVDVDQVVPTDVLRSPDRVQNLVQSQLPRAKAPGLVSGSTAVAQDTRSCRDNRLVDNSPPAPRRRGCHTVNILPGSGFNLPEPPMLNVNV